MLDEECVSNGALLNKKILPFTSVDKPITDKKLMPQISKGKVGKKTANVRQSFIYILTFFSVQNSHR